MFLKLMKQDVRATARLMLPVYIAAILLALFTRLFDFLSTRMEQNAFVSIAGALAGFLFSLTMIAIVIMSFVLMIWRFYKNYMTDEGYLMFTLPVNTAELIFSKLLVAVGWFFCTGLVTALATRIVSSGSGTVEVVGFDQTSGGEMSRMAVSGGVSFLIAGITFCLMLYACMALGQSFKRHKKGMAVLFFFVFYIVIMFVSVHLLSGVLMGLSDSGIMNFDNASMADLMTKLLWRSSAVSALFGVIFYAITHYMLAKRLNLQ